MNAQAFLALVRNDLRLFLADRKAVIVTVLIPVCIASFFGLIFGGGGSAGKDGQKGTIAVVVSDADHSAVSREIVENLKKDDGLTVTEVPEADARARVKAGKVPAALLLPAGFGDGAARAMFAGSDAERPTVTILHDPAHAAEYQMVRGLITQQAMQVVSKHAFSPDSAGKNADEQLARIAADPEMAPADKTALTDLLQSVKRYSTRPGAAASGDDDSSAGAPGMRMPVEIAEETAANGGKQAERLATVAHSFVGMAVQGILFFAIDAAMGMLRDRRLGLWKRLRAAPLSRGTLLGARLASTALIGVCILLCVFGAGRALFGIRPSGSALGFALLCASTAAMVAGFGLLIAALGKTEAQSRGFALPIVLGMSLLGGAWFPSFMMPRWVQSVSLTIPSRWAIDGFDAVTWRGLGLSAAVTPSLVLLGFAVAFGAFAFARFRWDAE
jgi:ABC-2 type transport system permease protein